MTKEWRYRQVNPIMYGWQVYETDGHYEDLIADELTEEQARLIAAAPDMADALGANGKLLTLLVKGFTARKIPDQTILDTGGDGPTAPMKPLSSMVQEQWVSTAKTLVKAGRTAE